MAKHATAKDNRMLEDDRTARPCPLCGATVPERFSTCPRCKSRMDAQPDEELPLSDAFTEDGKLLATAAARLTGTPEDTQPLPVLSPGPIPPSEASSLASSGPTTSTTPVVIDAIPTPILPTTAPETALPSLSVGTSPIPPAPAAPIPTTAPKRKRHGKHIAAGIAAGFATIAFIVGGICMANQANALNQITDELVQADVRADEGFTKGSASDAFTTPSPYSIDAVFIDSKEVLEGGVEVHATVRISNGFFEESRKAVLMYQKTEEGWQHTTTVASHTTKPTRGIDCDDEYGIAGVESAFDGTASCQVSIPIEGQSAGSWYASTWGTRMINYSFANDAWERTRVDDSQLTTSYQGLVGTYTSTKRAGNYLAYFAVSSVDDATATFTGEYVWREADGWLSAGRTIQGSFTGSIGEDGSLVSACDGQVGQIDFIARAAGDQTLQLDATIYREAGMFSLSTGPQGDTLTLTIQKETSEITGWQDNTPNHNNTASENITAESTTIEERADNSNYTNDAERAYTENWFAEDEQETSNTPTREDSFTDWLFGRTPEL